MRTRRRRKQKAMECEDLGYVKIHRKILEWGWYKDINTFRLFIHMLLKANWKEGKFKGTTVPRGSFVSSYPHLAEECGLTINELRSALKHLKSTGEVTVRTNNKYSIFTVNNYCKYQDDNSQDDSQSTGGAQSINSLLYCTSKTFAVTYDRQSGRSSNFREILAGMQAVRHMYSRWTVRLSLK